MGIDVCNTEPEIKHPGTLAGTVLRQLPPTHCGPDEDGAMRHVFKAEDDGEGLCQCGQWRVFVERVEVWK